MELPEIIAKKKRIPPSRKGAKHSLETRKKMSLSHTGVKLSESHVLAQSQGRLGSKNGAWKGQGVSYSGLHHWIKKQLGTPNKCEHCGKGNLKSPFIDWANKSGKYLRDLDDWLRLCRKCHKAYDRRFHGTE